MPDRKKTMTCNEVQGNIINYIENNMEEDMICPFIDHLRQCPVCYEEMEINYIMINALRDLDDNQDFPNDFRATIEEEMDQKYRQIVHDTIKDHHAKRIIIAVMLAFFLIAIVLIFKGL